TTSDTSNHKEILAMPSSKETGLLTVVAIRKIKGETQYQFSEKQAIFTLAGDAKARREAAACLKRARQKRLPIKGQIDTRQGLIHRATESSAKELEEFHRERILLEKPEKTNRVSVSVLDPTVFNLAGYHRGLRCFRAC